MENSGTYRKGQLKPEGSGRSKNTPNKTTSQIREIYTNIISDNLEQIKQDLAALKPEARLKLLMKISEFVLPKLSTIDASLTENRVIEIRDCTELGLP